MIRRVQFSLKFANKNKIEQLILLTNEMLRVKNLYINKIWERQDFSSKFIDFKIQDTWLSARLLQCIGKQALETIKTQRKKEIKTKPICKKVSFDLDSRFVNIEFDNNSFDVWIKLLSLGNKMILKLPSKKHKHFFKYHSWKLKNSIKLRKVNNIFYIDLFFEKDIPIKKTGETIGVDIGYKDLLVSSRNIVYDKGLENIYNKISRKKQNSNAFKRALIERNNKINESLNQINLSNIREIVAEELKNVKLKTKKSNKISKKFNKKLQRWSYPKVLKKLSYMCEENGVLLTLVNPSYTSQKCSQCGVICSENRNGKIYKCSCGLKIDADLNAAINISRLGVYSPHAEKIINNYNK